MEEPTEPAPGTVIAQVGQQDAEKEPSEPREREETAPKEETRRVVLVTMEPEESTEVIVKPPEQEPEKSAEATVKPTEPVEKERDWRWKNGNPKFRRIFQSRDPREAFCRDGESSRGSVRAGSDVSNESLVKLASSTRSERRGEANQKSSQAASAETAAPVGSGCRPSASSSKGTVIVTVMDCVEGRPRAERINQESAETAHQSSSEGADCEVAIGRTRSPSLPGYRKGRVHGAEQASSLDRAQRRVRNRKRPIRV